MTLLQRKHFTTMMNIRSFAGIAAAAFICAVSSAAAPGGSFGEKVAGTACGICGRAHRRAGTTVSGRPHGAAVFLRSGLVRNVTGERGSVSLVIETGPRETWLVARLERAAVAIGSTVAAGTVIGNAGSTGRIHVGVRRARYDFRLSRERTLPDCSHGDKDLPRFPESFADPGRVVRIR